MKEPASNVQYVCPAHGPKADSAWAKKKPAFFIGKFVKKAFQTNRDRPKTEHMWVRILEATKTGIVGVLDNDPVACAHLKCGDRMTVELAEIETVYDPEHDKELTP